MKQIEGTQVARTRSARGILAIVLALAWTAPGAAWAGGPSLSVSVGHPVAQADQATLTYLKVAISGQAWDGLPSRTPVNVAFVIDRSGSMAGAKIREARKAALTALGHLGPDDIVSVVIYDHLVDVLVPATKFRRIFPHTA